MNKKTQCILLFLLCSFSIQAQIDMSVFFDKKEMMALKGNKLTTAFDYDRKKPKVKCVSGNCEDNKGTLLIYTGSNHLLILGHFEQKKLNGEAIIYSIDWGTFVENNYPLADFEKNSRTITDLFANITTEFVKINDDNPVNDIVEVIYGNFDNNILTEGEYYYFNNGEGDKATRRNMHIFKNINYLSERSVVIPFRFLQLVTQNLEKEPKIVYHYSGSFSSSEVKNIYNRYNDQETLIIPEFGLKAPTDRITMRIDDAYQYEITPSERSKQFQVTETNLLNQTTDVFSYFEQDRYYSIYGDVRANEIEDQLAQAKRNREEKEEKTKEVLANSKIKPGTFVTDGNSNFYVSRLYLDGCIGINSLPFPNNQNLEYYSNKKQYNSGNNPLFASVYYSGDIKKCEVDRFQVIKDAAFCHVCNGNGNYIGYKDKNVSFDSEKTTYKTLHKGDYFEVKERTTTTTTSTGTVKKEVLTTCSMCQGMGALIIDKPKTTPSNSSSNSNFNWNTSSSSTNSSTSSTNFTVPSEIQDTVNQWFLDCVEDKRCIRDKLDTWFKKKEEQKSSTAQMQQLTADVTKAIYKTRKDLLFGIIIITGSKYYDYYLEIRDTDKLPKEISDHIKNKGKSAVESYQKQ